MQAEKDLIKKLYTKNQEAFQMIYEKYQSLVFAVAYNIVRDREVVEEIVQDTFVKLWKNIHTFDPDSNFQAWLLTIAKNTAKDYLKTQKNVELHEEVTIRSNYFPAKMIYELSADCQRVLNELEHNVIILTLVYNLKRREVAHYLGKPVGTILRVYKEAQEKLRSFYNLEKLKQ
ncbi:MAG: sigma-70 family RNA polymerase sigma factor [Acholeplasmataceae bacterium]|nr:sigma-70 family RNA polymerase sigma factor [Acholeplasmataceae bacterium]